MNELIIVKQLPIIEEHLMALKAEIENKTEMAMNLVCTEDTVKDVKAIRSELTKEFGELETQRKFVKEQVMKPYDAFELIYKECVSNIYKKADSDLKAKIDEVEEGLKKEKNILLVEYFGEYAKSKNVEFVGFAQTGIKVGLSDSMKSLKEKAKAFIDKVCGDVTLVQTQEHADEIMIEYEKSLNASQAITTVVSRYKALEARKEQEAARIEAQKQQEVRVEQIEKIAELKPPVAKPIEVVEEKKYKAVFEVTGTLDELKTVKAFLENGGYKYDSK